MVMFDKKDSYWEAWSMTDEQKLILLKIFDEFNVWCGSKFFDIDQFDSFANNSSFCFRDVVFIFFSSELVIKSIVHHPSIEYSFDFCDPLFFTKVIERLKELTEKLGG